MDLMAREVLLRFFYRKVYARGKWLSEIIKAVEEI